MLTETDIERLGYGHEAIFVDLQQQILSDIVRRIKTTDVITRTADFQINQLKQLGMSDREIYEKLHAALGRSDQYIDQVFKEAIETDYIDNKELYKAKGKEFIPFKENAYIQDWISAVSKQTKAEMHNLARQIGFVVRDKDGWITRPVPEYVRNLLDNAILQVQMGTFDYNTVLKKAVQEMTNSGIRFIEYGSGRMNRVTVAARRAVMTGTSQIVKQINEKTAEDLQTEHFEVTAHANARPSHALWQGRVYTRKELETVCGLGSVTGLLGANCYHLYYPFIPGVSKRTYTDEELEHLKNTEPKEYQNTTYTGYEAQQKMRRMETNMRAQREKIKLLKDGDADQIDILGAQAIYRRQMDDYVKFAKAMGMKQQKERIYIDGLGKMGNSYPEKRKVKDIQIPKSIGARWSNYDIIDTGTGEKYRFTEGTRLQDVEVFAGKGVKTPFRKARKYANLYGGNPEDWQHVKAVAIINTPDGDRKAEIHWFQCAKVGKFRFKVKRWLDES